jgi:hypothetical protein
MYSVSDINCWLIVRTALDFEVICPKETEINLTKFRLTDVFISWFRLRSGEFVHSGGLIAFRSELSFVAEISSLSFHISYTE